MSLKKATSGQRMQSVSFRSIEDFLEYLPPKELSTTSALRELVQNCIPGVKEKLSYNVPFFYKHSNICFIWPASVLWGKRKTYEGVRFGFTKGHLLSNENGTLEKGNRKYVYWTDLKELNQHKLDELKQCLYEAALLDSK